ncbi:MAG: hypothetical protein ABIS50_17220 [Luteolibacter sp.]|uniref:hypothetical protein n=1 Tax=Luteolibacter sp. TaxID=1962973 RepID=UPI003265328C
MITIFAHTTNSDWTSFTFALVGILIGGLVAHTFTKDRDSRMQRIILKREADIRKREFLRLVVRGCYRIQRPATPDHDPGDPWIAYNEAITEISAEFAMCEGDFPDAPRLLSALRAATTLEKEQVEAKVRESGKSHRCILTGFLADINDAASPDK